MSVTDQWMYAWIALALLLMVVQFFVTPGYGRHASARWGPSLPNQLGWMLMEAVALVSFWFGWWSAADKSPTVLVVVAMLMWTLHYVHRAFIYPLRTRTRGKRIPLVIVLTAVSFNSVNGAVIGASLTQVTLQLHTTALAGLVLFAIGAFINVGADNTLLALRKQGERGYKVPCGGLFNYVSCPNFLGEIIQWCGFALLCWNLPTLAFAVWTAANLLPRALAHHRWYQQTFADYPARRRALIPGLL